jgi:transposase
MAKWEKDEISYLRDIATDNKTLAEISNLLKNFTGKTRTTESVWDKCKKLKLPYKPKKKSAKKRRHGQEQCLNSVGYALKQARNAGFYFYNVYGP